MESTEITDYMVSGGLWDVFYDYQIGVTEKRHAKKAGSIIKLLLS